MINFKFLVKVDPSNPKRAAEKLGELILNDKNVFASVDPTWTEKQDYITALPIAVALTVEMRAVVQANSPDTKFIVTGVTTKNVSKLIDDFGYKVFPSANISEESGKGEEESKEKKTAVESAGQDTDGQKVNYYYNGRKVDQKEWQQHHDEFMETWNDVWKGFGEKLLELF